MSDGCDVEWFGSGRVEEQAETRKKWEKREDRTVADECVLDIRLFPASCTSTDGANDYRSPSDHLIVSRTDETAE